MPVLQARTQWWIGTALAALMVATRGAHLPALHVLPPASWAVFFLAGALLRDAVSVCAKAGDVQKDVATSRAVRAVFFITNVSVSSVTPWPYFFGPCRGGAAFNAAMAAS